MSGSHSDSHMPYSCSVHVPLTTKSSVTIGQPIRSSDATYGLCVFGSSPATTGSMKYGPNLQIKCCFQDATDRIGVQVTKVYNCC